jgi:rod shape-determining protein MreD
MRVLSSAIGAILAAIVDSSVLAQLQVGGIKPDLVLTLGIAVTLMLGFESGVTWALMGGLMVDILPPERVLGATALSLLLVSGLAMLVARVTSPRRMVTILAAVLVLGLLHQFLVLGLMAMGDGVGIGDVPYPALALGAALNLVLAVPAVLALRALELRFGDMERAEW